MTPTNEAGHGLPELPEPLISGGNDKSRPGLGRGCTGYTADQMRQYARDALALSRGVPADMGPSVTIELGKTGVLFGATVTGSVQVIADFPGQVNNCYFTAPAAAGAQGEGALTIPYERHEREILKVIDQRDRYHEIADDLASQIASITGADIGEHSSANCPWMEALQAADDYIARQAPQPAAADGGVRERAQSERHLDGLRISLCLGGVRLLSGPFDSPKAHGEAMRAINDSLSSHRQAGDESKFRELAERWLAEDARRHSAPTELSGCADDLIALVEKGAGNG